MRRQFYSTVILCIKTATLCIITDLQSSSVLLLHELIKYVRDDLFFLEFSIDSSESACIRSERKPSLFRYICRMNDYRFIKTTKTTVFGMLNGTSKRGRPAREWLDDVRDWCNQDIHTHSQSHDARPNEVDRNSKSCDTNGH